MNRSLFPIVFAAFFQVAVLPAVGAMAAERVVWMSPNDCAAITAHRPDPSVEYRAGIDASGRAVAPADLPGHEGLTIDPEDVSIELRIPLSEFYEAPTSLQPLVANAEIDPGRITVRDGVAYLGEQRLAGQEQNALARACAERL